MKKLLAIVVLGLLWCNVSSADITDLQIEGISLHDSLLDHMNQNDINQAEVTYYPKSKKFKMIKSSKISNLDYDMVFLSVKDKDPNYIIHEIKTISLIYNLTDCFVQRNDIVKDLKKVFKNEFLEGKVKIDRYEDVNDDDKTGESLTNSVDFLFKDGKVRVYCDYFGKEYRKKYTNQNSHLSVIIYDNEFRKWLNEESQ